MNGGAGLSLEGTKVDVLLRDLDVTMYWSAALGRATTRSTRCSATSGGAPIYSFMAELALSRAVKGCLRAVRQFPDALSRDGGRRWTLLSASPMRGCVPSVAISPALSAKRLRPSSRRLTPWRAAAGSWCSTRRGSWS